MAKKSNSRTARWADASGKLREAFDKLKGVAEEHQGKIEALVDEAKEELEGKIETAMDLAKTELAPLLEEVDGALSDLASVKEEYDEWEEPKAEATKEKLETLQNLDLDHTLDMESEVSVEISAQLNLEPDMDTLEGVVDEAEAIELPLGFGRD